MALDDWSFWRCSPFLIWVMWPFNCILYKLNKAQLHMTFATMENDMWYCHCSSLTPVYSYQVFCDFCMVRLWSVSYRATALHCQWMSKCSCNPKLMFLLTEHRANPETDTQQTMAGLVIKQRYAGWFVKLKAILAWVNEWMWMWGLH